ncbi:hypothetical protein [Streptomyces clavifer]|uniref:hypothetical protein n=1 Tax=Streptomyces clavifer TaxID=68188 RepID=UPI0037F9716B
MEETEALARAVEFGKAKVSGWDDLGFQAKSTTTIYLAGHYAFTYSPTKISEATGRAIRVGGNFPILVSSDTGECRFVQGADEYMKLKLSAKGTSN